MDGEALADKYKLWMASYSKSPDHYTDATYAFWQYTSSGNGYDIGMKSPRVDMDYWYNDGSIDEKPTPTEKAIYRLYNPVNGEHLYTTDVNEKMSCHLNMDGNMKELVGMHRQVVHRCIGCTILGLQIIYIPQIQMRLMYLHQEMAGLKIIMAILCFIQVEM